MMLDLLLAHALEWLSGIGLPGLGIEAQASAGAVMNPLQQVYASVRSAPAQVAGQFMAVVPTILAGAAAIVIVKSWIEHYLDGDLIGWINDIVRVAVTAAVIFTLWGEYDRVQSIAWSVMDDMMRIMDVKGMGDGSSPIERIVNAALVNLGSVLDAMFGVFKNTNSGDSECEAWNVACHALTGVQAIGSNILIALIFFAIVLLVVLYFVVVLLQSFTGLFMIAVGLMLLPLCLAFYPLIESWTKNAIGLIAAGAVHQGIVVFLLSMTEAVVADAIRQFAENPTNNVWGGGAQTAEVTGGVIYLGLVLCAFMAVLGLTTSRIVAFATQIFGPVSGTLSPSKGAGTAKMGKMASDGKGASTLTDVAPSAGGAGGGAKVDAAPPVITAASAAVQALSASVGAGGAGNGGASRAGHQAAGASPTATGAAASGWAKAMAGAKAGVKTVALAPVKATGWGARSIWRGV